ncbi:hypothetical protein ACH4ZX_13100 [Streptomyces sp. NPDC020490]|uniref:hypothetical protein n=1 Tax=Streptomyces sp. NPDC020490 TaxID=3365078 RepID=UPI0037906E5C
MIYRHFIAPPRAFTQFSHDLIRHPRLSSDAVRLLTWQLSLPEGARESLSRTAERARIGGCAFTRAKRQLKDEGFVHERRVQGPGGHWVTQQLVSNVPLSPGEAAKLLARMPVSPQVAPSAPNPIVGERTGRLTDGLPYRNTCGNTSNQPPKPPEDAPDAAETAQAPEAPHPSPAPQAAQAQEAVGHAHGSDQPDPPLPRLDEARALVDALPALSPDLRHIPRAMHAELTDLTARWLAAGHPPAAVRLHILRGLPDDGTPVRRPGGLLRHLLRDVPPPVSPAPAPAAAASPPRTPDAGQPGTPPPPHPSPRLSARLTGTRECAGDHLQPMLFRPVGDETLCRHCLNTPPAEGSRHTPPVPLPQAPA